MIGLEQRAQLVVGDRFIRSQLQHLAELRYGVVLIALLSVINAEIEPGVRK